MLSEILPKALILYKYDWKIFRKPYFGTNTVGSSSEGVISAQMASEDSPKAFSPFEWGWKLFQKDL